MAVQVHRCWQQAPHPQTAPRRADRGDPPIGNLYRDIARPTLGQKGMVGVQQHGLSLTLVYVQT